MNQFLAEYEHRFALCIDGYPFFGQSPSFEAQKIREYSTGSFPAPYQPEPLITTPFNVFRCMVSHEVTVRIVVDDDFAMMDTWMEGGLR